MTNERIAEIRARIAAATPGPWEWRPGRDSIYLCADGIFNPADDCVYCESGRGSGCMEQEDQAFVTNARQDLPDVLDALDARDGLLREVQAQLALYQAKLAEFGCASWLDAEGLQAKIGAMVDGGAQGPDRG